MTEMMGISLNKVSAAVLLRCLNYGENAISQVEEETGEARIIRENVHKLRSQVTSALSRELIRKELMGG